MVQQIVYEKYQNHWYLIIDSDIILPNNFIDILIKEELNEECIYGALRNNLDKSSDILNPIIPDHHWVFNNIIRDHSKAFHFSHSPSILGCFQLYKKREIFYKNSNDSFLRGADYDYHFGYDNFDLFCNLENLVYLHLGRAGINWKGKVENFNNDCNINLNQIYFNCNIKCKNIYYDKHRKILNIKNKKSVDVCKPILIYSCVFFNKNYLKLLELLLNSFKKYNNVINVDYLIITNPDFKNKIENIFNSLDIPGKIFTINYTEIFQACYSRLNIFDYQDIDKYSKILYLDTDILITNDISNILELKLDKNILYTLEEGFTNEYEYGGGYLFEKNNDKFINPTSAFTSGILFFNNCNEIKELFANILNHIKNNTLNFIPATFDQPFIVYHAVKNNLYDNQKLINIVINNPTKFNNETISHFPGIKGKPGGVGNFEDKYERMKKYSNIINKSINIHDDIWTCSDEFREEIKDFFKEKSHYKIAEIGSHKGYTTRFLSNIFKKVYAVDNSVEWTNFNKSLNNDRNNIEYVHLNIYKDSWDIIPDVDVVFIDALHSYEHCKSDMYNSLKRFKNLKYIIFDDYGVWSGVKQIVNESLTNQILTFEKYIGINNVPGLRNEVFKNTAEGIICRINQLLNKKYTWNKSTIEFLKNGKMKAFGEGKYEFIDKYLVKCFFGNKEHLFKFNKNYLRFISIKKVNFDVQVGNLL